MKTTKTLFITSIVLFLSTLLFILAFNLFGMVDDNIYNVIKSIFLGSITFVLTTTITFIVSYINLKHRLCDHYHTLISDIVKMLENNPSKAKYHFLINLFSSNCLEIIDCSTKSKIVFLDIIQIFYKHMNDIFQSNDPLKTFNNSVKKECDILINTLANIHQIDLGERS